MDVGCSHTWNDDAEVCIMGLRSRNATSDVITVLTDVPQKALQIKKLIRRKHKSLLQNSLVFKALKQNCTAKKGTSRLTCFT